VRESLGAIEGVKSEAPDLKTARRMASFEVGFVMLFAIEMAAKVTGGDSQLNKLCSPG